jgi:hypothetical protein
MEPMLFRLEWDVTLEVLFTVSGLAFFSERALSLLFEHRRYETRFGGRGPSELIAYAVSVLIVWYCEFDALAILMQHEANAWPGYLITGAMVAGGSKASINLFHDLLDVRSTYERRKQTLINAGATRKVASEMAAHDTGARRGSAEMQAQKRAVLDAITAECGAQE